MSFIHVDREAGESTHRPPEASRHTALNRPVRVPIIQRSGPLILPFLLTLLPILLLWWQSSEDDSRREALRGKHAVEGAARLGKRLQEQVVPRYWPEEWARRLRTRMEHLHTTRPDTPFPAILAQACLDLDTPSSPHHIRGLRPPLVWGISFTSDGKPYLVKAPRLEPSYGSLVSGIFSEPGRSTPPSSPEVFRPSTSARAELSALRLKPLFGPSIVPEAFAEGRRGKAFAVIHRGVFGFLLWDRINLCNRRGELTLSGGIVAFQPLDARDVRPLLKLCLLNWRPHHGLYPAFLPLDPSFTLSRMLIHPSLRTPATYRMIQRFAKGFRLKPGRLPDHPVAEVRLPFTRINQRISLGNQDQDWGVPVTLPPHTGHLAVLTGPPRPPRTSATGDAAWLATILFGAGWLLILTRVLLFDGLPSLHVRNSLLAWLAGVVAMPIVLSLGTTARYQSDLSSNLEDRLRQKLSDTLKQVETGAGVINEKYLDELHRIAADPAFRQLLLDATTDKGRIPALRAALVERFLRAGLPINGFFLFGRNHFTVDHFAGHITGDVRKIFTEIVTGLWNNFLEMLATQERGIGSGTPDPDAAPKSPSIAGLFPEIKISNTSQIIDGMDTVQIGTRPEVLGKKVIPIGGGFGFFFVIWAEPAGLHRTYLTERTRARSETGRPRVQAFTIDGDTLHPLVASDESHPRSALLTFASRGLKEPFWSATPKRTEFVHARTSARFPGFVLLASASLDELSSRLRQESIRSALIIAGLVLLLVLVARALETRLARPIEAMSRTLEAIADGNLDIRLEDPRRDELGESARTIDTMTAWLQERRLTSQFVSPEVLEVIGGGTPGQALAGSRRQAVLLVSDIRGFTTLTETHPPEAIFQALDRHLTEMTAAIKEQGGLIDRFIGDAVQAVFYPKPGADPGETTHRAVQAALGMVERHRHVQESRRKEGTFTWEIGVGIEGGEIIAGVMGDPESRLDFSVLGEPLRKAGELESLSRYGSATRIVVSSEVQATCNRRFHMIPLAGHPGLFELLDRPSNSSDTRNSPPNSPPAKRTPIPEAVSGEERPGLLSDRPSRQRVSIPSAPLLLAMPFFLLLFSLFGFATTRREHADSERVERLRRGFRLIESSSDPYLQNTIDFRRRVSHFQKLLHQSPSPLSSQSIRKASSAAFSPLSSLYPHVRWFAFNHRYLPPKPVPPLSPAQIEETGGRQYQAFPGTSVRLIASGGTNNDLGFTADDAHSLIDLARTQLLDRVQEYPTLDSLRMCTPSASWGYERFPKLFGVAGKMSLARFLDHSIGKTSFILLEQQRYLLFWDFFVHREISHKPLSERMKHLQGGVVILFPLEDLTPATQNHLLVGNAAALGMEAALVASGDEPRRLCSTPAFRRVAVLGRASLASADHEQRIAGYLIAQRPLAWNQSLRLVLAVPGRISFPLPTPALVLLLLGGLGLFVGVLNHLSNQARGFSLRWQLAGGFLLVLVPALVHAAISLDRSRSERLDRLGADTRKHLEERLHSFDESHLLEVGRFVSFFDSRFGSRSYAMGIASLSRSCSPPHGRSASRDMAIPIGEYDHQPFRGVLDEGYRHGIPTKQIGAIGPNRFSAGFDQKPPRLEVVHGVFAPTIKALVPGGDGVRGPSMRDQRDLLVGSEIDKAMNMFRSMLPPEGWAAMTAEPRHLQGFANPRSFQFQFFLRHAFAGSTPLGVTLVFWDGRGAALQQLANWRLTPSSDVIRNGDLQMSLPLAPAFRLTPPFFSWAWEEALGGKIVTTVRSPTPSEMVTWHIPTVTTLNLLADALQETIFTGNAPRPGRRLRAALPGRVMNGVLLHGSLSWNDLLGPLNTAIRQDRLLLLALILLAIGLADRTANRFLEPLVALVSAARRIMDRDFTVRLPVEGEDEFGRLAGGFNRMAAGVEEGRILSRFVSESVRLAVSDRGSGKSAEPSREARSGTSVIMFIGLPEFGSRMKTESAPALIQDLNLYLGAMAALIRSQGGEIDKFIGEKILAVFHPDRLGGLDQARNAALEVAAAMPGRLSTLAPWKTSSLGIGIVTGTVLSGILGTEQVRLEYTVIGDPVNLASRLCDMACKQGLGTITEAGTAAYCREHGLSEPVSLGPVTLKGKARQVEVFRLLPRPTSSDR